MFKQLSHRDKTATKSNGRAAVIASLRTTIDRSNHLGVVMNNALTELDYCQSPSSMDSSSLPPPMYQTVYADDQFMLNDLNEHPSTINPSNDDALLLMECYCATENLDQNEIIENQNSSNGAILNYATSCTTGSISWSQAETIPFGINSHHGFVSPTSQMSTNSNNQQN